MPIKDPEARKEYIRQWKEKNRRSNGICKRQPMSEEERKQRRKESRDKYLERNPQIEAQWRTKYIRNNPEKRLLWAARKRAKEQGLPFDLSELDIVIPTHCPYLHIEMTTNAKRGESRSSVYSLDKINPTLGYVKGNIEVISHLANTMKSNATEEQLLEFAKTIIKRYGKVT